MTSLGQFCLLVALVGSGYAAFACMIGGRGGPRLVVRSGVWAAAASILALTTAVVLLAQALIVKDFRFQYVTEYSDALLPWHYSLSAFWVGQGGSLLLWAWFVAALAIVYRFAAGRRGQEFRDLAFGTLMAYLCFLVTIMVFAADPMQPSLVARHTGDGLSPLLQHPAMLFHPPIIFLGYAAWGVPFALAVAALLSGRLDNTWTEQARPWAIFAWVTLGGGILWGAAWAYEELGWGGYWSWDPVENGSLIPWLTGTALVHGLMTWRCRGALKKTTLSLAIATFALCNFATFLTRSGVFSSLHAFSQSPIGWMFLAWIVVVTAGHAVLMILRRAALGAERPLTSVWSREAFVLIGIVALVLLASMAILGTLAAPLSGVFCTARIVVGIAFYNHVLIPVGLILLTAMAATPLLRWGSRPAVAQGKCSRWPPLPGRPPPPWPSRPACGIPSPWPWRPWPARPSSPPPRPCSSTPGHGAPKGPGSVCPRRWPPTAGDMPPISCISASSVWRSASRGPPWEVAGATSPWRRARRSDGRGGPCGISASTNAGCLTRSSSKPGWRSLTAASRPICCCPRTVSIGCKTNGVRRWPFTPRGAETFTRSSMAATTAARSI